jgi:hypothetical protein
VLKPTLLTRLKGIASTSRRLFIGDKSSCGTYYSQNAVGNLQGAQGIAGGYQLASNMGGISAPLQREVFDETAYLY